MPGLDHTSFPHIMDAILVHAPRSALLALRATSRAFRALADDRLCSHAELHVTAPNSWRVRTASGPLPCMPGDVAAPCLRAIRVLTLRTPASQMRMARKDLLLPPLALDAHTLVLPHPFRLAIDDLAPALSRLVVHAALGRSFNCDKTGWFFPPTLEACVSPWAARYALHVAVPPDEPELHATRCAFSVSRLHGQDKGEEEEQSARDVVVVFRVSPGRAARAIQPPRPLGILHDFAEAAADHPAWRWTVVGVQEMAEAAPHAVPLQEGVYARFMDVAGPAQVRFCTVAEYARSGEGLLEIGEA